MSSKLVKNQRHLSTDVYAALFSMIRERELCAGDSIKHAAGELMSVHNKALPRLFS